MPKSSKPISVELRNQRVSSGAQRVQAQWWTAPAARKSELQALWPELASAIDDLDQLLQLPVVSQEPKRPSGRLPGRPGD